MRTLLAWRVPQPAPLAVLALVLLVASDAGARADDEDRPKKPPCYVCHGAGKHEPVEPPPPEWIVHDSHYYRSDPDRGVGFALCDRISVPEVEKEYREIRARNEAWLREVEEFERVTGTECAAVEGEQLRVFLALPRVEVDDRRVDRVQGARRYLALLEEVHADTMELLGVEKPKKTPMLSVYIHENQRAYGKFMREHFGSASADAAGHKHVTPQFCWYVTRKGPETDEALEQRVVYNLGFLLIYKFARLQAPPPWLDLGFASFVENRRYGTNRNYYFIEVPPDDSFRNESNWKKRLRREAGTGEYVPLVDLHDRDINAFGYRDAAYAFGYVDFLYHQDPEKFRQLVWAVESGRDTMQTILDLYGWLPSDVDEAWRKYAIREYSSRR